jgi:hypothetical protein
MKTEDVERIISEAVPTICATLGIRDWIIEAQCARLDEGQAKCEAKPGYQHAALTFDPGEHEDEADVLASVRHELLHTFAAEMETYRAAVQQLVSDREFAVLDQMFSLASESLVRRIEKLLDTKVT